MQVKYNVSLSNFYFSLSTCSPLKILHNMYDNILYFQISYIWNLYYVHYKSCLLSREIVTFRFLPYSSDLYEVFYRIIYLISDETVIFTIPFYNRINNTF